MNYALEELTKQRVKDIKFLSLLDGKAFITALDYMDDYVLIYEIKNEILEHFNEEFHEYWELAKKRFESLEEEQRREIISKALKRVEKECLCEPKQKIALLSKKRIKKALEISLIIDSFYQRKGFTLNIMEKQNVLTKFCKSYSSNDVRELNIKLVSDSSVRVKMVCELLGFCEFKDAICKDGNLYDFVLMAISMLNKDQNYFEFEFSKDEE